MASLTYRNRRRNAQLRRLARIKKGQTKMIPMQKHIAMLGYRVKDKVTGLEGVVVSISFDLYGCVQAIVNPGADKDGKLKDQVWFDVARLELTSKKPVMTPPNFDYGTQAEGKQGAAEKPAHWKA